MCKGTFKLGKNKVWVCSKIERYMCMPRRSYDHSNGVPTACGEQFISTTCHIKSSSTLNIKVHAVFRA